MTKRLFIRQLSIIAGVSFFVILVAAADVFVFDPANNRVSTFIREMSVYFLLCVAPYIAYVFSVRQKFIEKIEGEWRRVVEVKSDIWGYCDSPSVDDLKSITKKLSCAIDNMRCIYRHVGQDRHYIGYYPFETLHDFRRILENIKFSNEVPPSPEALALARQRVEDAFNAFRDIYLIEIDPPEPSFPIIVRGMKRQKKPYVSPEKDRDIDLRQAKMKAYFAVSGNLVRER